MNQDGTERLAKVLASRGVASRREAERMITEGKVTVNGEKVSHPGHPVDPKKDHIRVDGRRLPREPKQVYYVLNKPKGYITGRDDPKGRRSVLELLGEVPERVEPVGRLDFNTEGALVLTNDGDLAHALAHPSSGIPKRYLAKVYRCPSDQTLTRIQDGVMLEDGKTAPCRARVLKSTDSGNTWLEVTVTEGKNRLVRRLLAHVGHPVSKLRRESFATISVRGLEVGQYRELTGEEIQRLRDLSQGVVPAAAGRKARGSKAGFAKADPAWIAKREGKRYKRPSAEKGEGATAGASKPSASGSSKPGASKPAFSKPGAKPGAKPGKTPRGPERVGVSADSRGKRPSAVGGKTAIPAPRGGGRGGSSR